MAIADDHTATAGEPQRIQPENQPEQTEVIVPIGVLRVPTIRYLSRQTWDDGATGRSGTTSAEPALDADRSAAQPFFTPLPFRR